MIAQLYLLKKKKTEEKYYKVRGIDKKNTTRLGE